MKIERRKTPRYWAIQKINVLGSHPDRVAAVHNIGAGGMQVQYFPEKKGEQPAWSRVDVITADHSRVLMRDVVCRVTYDIPNLVECYTFSGRNVRLCGLCFEELTPDQQAALQGLLEDCQTGQATT